MFTQAYQHGLMQLLPYAGLTPLTQSSPACHPAAIAQSLRKVFPWNACAQHKQDAVEGGFITDGAAAATFAGCNERGNEGLQLLPQLFADGGAGHKAAKHKCVCSLQIAVVLAALRATALSVHHDLGGGDTSEFGKVVLHAGVGHGIREIANVDFAAHGVRLCY